MLISADTDFSSLLARSHAGLAAIETADVWSGAAADAFRKRFHGHPEKRQAARDKLGRARRQLADVGDRAARAVGAARDKAPHKPGFWSHVGDFFSGLGHDVEHAGADVVNALASTGNAAIHHPLDVLGMVGGGALAAVSATGEGAGFLLDATGAGAVAGVPLNVVSAAGVAAGATLAMASTGDLASHAAGDDAAEPVQVDDGGDTAGPAEDPQHFQNLGMDPATGQFRQTEAETASRIENATGMRLERSPDAKGPDWTGSDGKTYDAVGNFPGKYFDQQWPNLQSGSRITSVRRTMFRWTCHSSARSRSRRSSGTSSSSVLVSSLWVVDDGGRRLALRTGALGDEQFAVPLGTRLSHLGRR